MQLEIHEGRVGDWVRFVLPEVFSQQFPVLTGVVLPFITQNTEARVAEAGDDNIVEFGDGISTTLSCGHQLNNSNNLLEKSLANRG